MSGQAPPSIVFLPEKLNAEIDARLLTNREAAKMLGVSENTLLRWRNSQTEPRRVHVRRMAEVFEREPRWFVQAPNVPEAA